MALQFHAFCFYNPAALELLWQIQKYCFMKKAFTFALALLAAASAWAYDFKSGDLYYNITDETAKTVEVTYEQYNSSNNYSYLPSTIAIPATVTYNNIQYNITDIGASAFSNCDVLNKITIPTGVTSIGEKAFAHCDVLTQVNIPNTVTSIGNYAFSSCDALRQINIPSSVTIIGNWGFSSCSTLTQITIPNNVTNIGYGAFFWCDALAQIIIGNSVKTIEDRAFYDCSALTEITVLAIVPPTVKGDAFYNISRNIPVYVPAEALESYKTADVWSEFNLHAMPATDLQTPSMPESISVYGGMLHNPQQLRVSIYDMQGRMVYSGTATTVSQPAGVYVLRCAGASGKVLF